MSSVSDYASNIHTVSNNIDIAQIAKILAFRSKQLPKIELDEFVKNIIYSPLIDLHDTTFTIGESQIIQNEFNAHFALPVYSRFLPPTIKSYDLIHDNSNASGITFRTPGTAPGAQFHGSAVSDGASFMIINDNPLLKPTDKITIAVRLYIPTSPTPSIHYILSKENVVSGYSISYGSTIIDFAIRVGALFRVIQFTYPKDQWFTLVVSYDSTFGVRGKIDNGATVTDTSATGSIIGNTVNLTILSRDAGTVPATVGTAIAWLSIIHGEVIAPNGGQWVTDYENGLLNLDTSDNSNFEEITTIPFAATLDEEPNSTSGFWVSGP